MRTRQWDISILPFNRDRRHTAVILSNDEICQNNDLTEVNALLYMSAMVNRPTHPAIGASPPEMDAS
jgi:hypothetical protein